MARRPVCRIAPILGQDMSISFQVVDAWSVKVIVPDAGVSSIVHVSPPLVVRVNAEEYKSIPVFNLKVGGWLRGAQLRGVKAQETTSPRLLDPDSFRLRSVAASEAPLLRQGVDYEIDCMGNLWATVGWQHQTASSSFRQL